MSEIKNKVFFLLFIIIFFANGLFFGHQNIFLGFVWAKNAYLSFVI